MNRFFTTIFRSDIFERFTQVKYMPRWVVLIVDIIIAFGSLAFAGVMSVQINHGVIDIGVSPIMKVATFMLSQMFFFWVFRTYSGVIRYSSFVDAVKILFAVLSHALLMLVTNNLLSNINGELWFNETVLILYAIFAFSFLFLLRLFVKTIFDFSGQSNGTVPVLIYGAQSSGISIAKMLQSDRNSKYSLFAFIDNNKDLQSKELMGVKVYELSELSIQKILARKVNTVIVSPQKSKDIDLKYDLDIFIDNGMVLKMMPPVDSWNNETPSLKQLKAIQIEDLLDRPAIELTTDVISEKIKDKTVLVTGGAGSIGREIVTQCVAFTPKLLIVLDQSESALYEMELQLTESYPKLIFAFIIADVRNQKRIESIIATFRPEIIFHAAAYKHVPLMEDNPGEAIQVNVKGTKNLADLAVKYNASRFVMISTDKAVNPTNVMGASKRIAEIYVQSLNDKVKREGGKTKFITTRFGNVLGSNGSVVPRFTKQIAQGGPLTVTHPDIIRYFMTIPEACMLVLEAGATGNGGEIFIFDMGGPVKISDLARKMIRLAGYIPDKEILIKYTGLRPGEKLYEELLNNKEETLPTHHPKIMVAKVRQYNFDAISLQFDDLIHSSYLGKDFITVTAMKKIVPEFVSNNSRFEKLDVEMSHEL